MLAKIPKTVYDGRVRRIRFIKKIIIIQIFIFCLSFIFSKNALADFEVTQSPIPVYSNSQGITITVHTTAGTFTNIENYFYGLWSPDENPNNFNNRIDYELHKKVEKVDNTTFKMVVDFYKEGYRKVGTWNYKIWSGFDLTQSAIIYSGSYYLYPPSGPGGIGFPQLQISSPVQEFTPQTLTIVNIAPNEDYTIYFDGDRNAIQAGKFSQTEKNDKGQYVATIKINVGGAQSNKRICLTQGKPFMLFGLNCDFGVSFNVTTLAPDGSSTQKNSGQVGVPNSPQSLGGDNNSSANTPPVCPKNDKGFYACNTALGPISTDPAAFVQRIFSLVLGIAGGIALILIIISGYKFMASQGNPESVKAATEQLTSAIVGLLFIILSFVILQVIGVDILRIPGFTK